MTGADAEQLAARGETQPGGHAWQRFEALLEREHDAARRADVEALVTLQVAKRKLLDELRASNVPDDALVAMHKRAQFNVTLIRHLVQCLSGLVSEHDDGTYDALGQRAQSLTPRVRGAL